MDPEAKSPDKLDISQITQILQETLSTPISVNQVSKQDALDHMVFIFWWRTATAEIERGKQALQYVQMQIEFVPSIASFQIDFMCLPEGQKHKGKGKKIIETIKDLGRRLGYRRIILETIEGSYRFWLSAGFIPAEPGRTSFPQPMYFEL